VRTDAAEATRTEGRSAPREDGRPEGRSEARGEGRRGPRAEREPRRTPVPPTDAPEGDAASPRAFDDTQPGGESPEAGEAGGERQGGRRRNRRGGRGGRDRDEAPSLNEGSSGAAPVDGAEPSQDEAGSPQAAPEERDSVAPETLTEGADTGERRRRGRGRDRARRERGPDNLAENTGESTDMPTAPLGYVEHVAEQAGEPAAPALSGGTPQGDAPVPAWIPPPVAAAQAVAAQAEVAPVEVAPVAAPVPASIPAPTLAPAAVLAVAPVAPTAPVEAFVLPMDNLQALAESAGLQWVNSDTEKVRAVQAAIAAQPPAAHVARERKPAAVVDDGPLVLVETRKDLSQIKLPFESAGGSAPPAV